MGNALDGESHAAEPREDTFFPSGDGQPGGDIVARFTLDSRPEVGVYHSGSVWVDTNGNFAFDPDGVPNPATGIVDPAGINGFPVAGNFDGNPLNGD
jgi:hypothetical protein